MPTSGKIWRFAIVVTPVRPEATSVSNCRAWCGTLVGLGGDEGDSPRARERFTPDRRRTPRRAEAVP